MFCFQDELWIRFNGHLYFMYAYYFIHRGYFIIKFDEV